MANGRDDIRVAIGLPRHVKTRRLIQALGYEGFYRLVVLWTYAAENHPDGVFPSEEDIEIAAEWSGEPGRLRTALVSFGWLEPDARTLHDWIEEQPYVAERHSRIEASRIAGRASVEARRAKNGTAQPQGRWKSLNGPPNDIRTAIRTPPNDP